MAVTMKEVARYAAVSTATVSRVLSRPDLVNPETREKVLEAIAELGYQMNHAARSLRTRQTATLGIVVTTLQDPPTAQIVQQLEILAFEAGYTVQLGVTNNDARRAETYLNSMGGANKVDGAFYVASGKGQPIDDVAARWQLAQFPPLILLNALYGEMPAFYPDYISGCYALVQHLAGQGHREIAFLRGETATFQAESLQEGYLLALGELGLTPRLLTETEIGASVSALIVPDLLRAGRVMQQIQAGGGRIPEEISLACAEDGTMADYLNPPLTTLRYPIAEMVNAAFEHLLALMAGEAELSPTDNRFRPELIHRASTAPR